MIRKRQAGICFFDCGFATLYGKMSKKQIPTCLRIIASIEGILCFQIE